MSHRPFLPSTTKAGTAKFDTSKFSTSGGAVTILSPGGGGTASWTQLATSTISTAVTTLDFLSISSSYKDYMLVFKDLAFTSASLMTIKFSGDNLSTLMTCNSNSIYNGTATVATGSNLLSDNVRIGGNSAVTYSGRFGYIQWRATDIVHSHGFAATAATDPAKFPQFSTTQFFINTTGTPINAIRIDANGTVTMTAGTFYLYGM